MEGTRKLTYPGDRRSAVGQKVGPDMFGGMWKIVDARYSPEVDKTRVGLLPHVEEEEDG